MTFHEIIIAFPVAAVANRLLAELWMRGSAFSQPRAWVESRRGNWWATILCSPSSLSGVTGTILTMGMFATMEGLDSSYAQFALVYALMLIWLPETVLNFFKSSA